jgi:predicted dehydrogenase
VPEVPAPRWGILGTANIARVAFLPALREAGGRVTVVGSRERSKAEAFAAAAGAERAVQGYEAVLGDPDVDAIYVALPNNLHSRWTIQALEAGKAVLCEKPLCLDPDETETVLAAVRRTGGLLWEAFVFPFGPQYQRLCQLIGEGVIGELREVQSSFHFLLSRPENIRLSKELGGGALNDVGCYPVRLSRDLFAAEPTQAWARGNWGLEVETEMWGSLGFPGQRQLLFSCGFARSYDTYTRLLGSQGQIHVRNPFHPKVGDLLEVHPAEGTGFGESPTTDEGSFTAALRHIAAVLAGHEEPRHLALDTAPGNARSLQMLAAEAREATERG